MHTSDHKNSDASDNVNDQAVLYAHDIAALYAEERLRREQLEAATERLQTIMSSMHEGIATISPSGMFTSVNPALCEMWDIPEEEFLGQDVSLVIHDPSLCLMLRSHDQFNKTYAFTIVLDKELNKTASVSVYTMQDNERLIVFKDTTAETRASNMKREFISILSHELRTPLNGIDGFSQLLLSDPIVKKNSDVLDAVQQISMSAQRMNATTSQLLHLADIQSESVASIDERIDAVNIVFIATKSLDRLAKDRAVNIVMDISPQAKAEVIGRSSLLMEMFRHIIHNGIVYGRRDGSVVVSLRTTKSSHEFTITDDGIGIPSAEMERVFQGFYQVKEYRTRNVDGLGLGLTLARQIAKLHKGTLTLESKRGCGVTCKIVLPVAV